MIEIRRAETKDATAIAAIILPTIRAGETYAINRQLSEVDALVYWLGGDKETYVALADGEIVGTYYLRAKQDGGARVTITDIRGEQVAQLEGPSDAGLNRVSWNMRAGAAAVAGGRGGFGGRGGGPVVASGDYRITVEIGGQQQTTVGRVRERMW